MKKFEKIFIRKRRIEYHDRPAYVVTYRPTNEFIGDIYYSTLTGCYILESDGTEIVAECLRDIAAFMQSLEEGGE